MKTLKEKKEISKCLACNGTGLVEIGNVGHFNSNENTYCKTCNGTGISSLKENTLREEFIKEYLNEPFVLGKSELSDIADFWLQKRQSEFDELERRMKGNTISHNGFYNKGVQDSISILNEMRGEK